MSDEPFPEATRTDSAAMFRYLSENTDLMPAEMALELVFAIECSFEFRDESITLLIDSIAAVIDADEDALRVEVHAFDQDDDDFSDSESSQLLLIYTGTLTKPQLEEVHAELKKATRTLGAQYVGVECGLPGEMDGMKVDSFIEWTDELMHETTQWEMDELENVADFMRSRHIESARELGLDVADWMPTAESRGFTQLRPQAEIVRRLMAANATVAWVCAPDEGVSSADIKRYIKDNGLKRSSFSRREAEWLGTARNDVRESMPQAGWITENMWGLAWILGNAPTVCPCEQQVPQSILADIRDTFFRTFNRSFDELMTASQLQPLELIVTLEDFLYCIHNGFRNMQNVECGGLIQERRQALTWALSPGVLWDDTDVST